MQQPNDNIPIILKNINHNRNLVVDVLMFIMIVVFLIGCKSSSSSKTTIPILFTNTISPKSSYTPTVTSTPTKKPTKTKIIPSPTTTSTISIPTMRPTLSSDESEFLVLNWLKTNSNCDLPCIFGIKPGSTTVNEENQLFHYANWNGGIYTGTLGPIYWAGYDLPQKLSIIYSSSNKNGIVETIGVGIGGPDFNNLAKYFSFQHIITVAGIPTQIKMNLHTGGEIGTPDITSFSLLLFYDKTGVLVDFYGNAVKVGSAYRICPSNLVNGAPETITNGAVNIYSKSLNEYPNWESIVQQLGGALTGYKTIENSTEMTVEDFYNDAVKNDAFCFETQRDIWP